MDSGFSVFSRRINEQLQLCGLEDLPFYRMGESENFVLSSLGCPVGM